MATPTPSPSPDSLSPSLTTASWRSVWQRRLFWLISALSGTLETEMRIAELRSEKEQIKNETEQIRKDNERLAVLESKIDGLFLKYNIGLKIPQPPDQP
jgi:hypothetical protein